MSEGGFGGMELNDPSFSYIKYLGKGDSKTRRVYGKRHDVVRGH